MSQVRTNCPQCGAPVTFAWSSSVQTTCEYCHSVLVRHDVNIDRVGQVADLPVGVSPIQLRTEGIYNGKAFTVAGRILYEWENGGWNEWHLMFQDGQSGWLSDAQAEYFITFPAKAAAVLDPNNLVAGQAMELNGHKLEVATITRARYAGVEGELPFEYWDKNEVLFVDLRSHSGAFGTIDYSETPPITFFGHAVQIEDLRLKNLREFEGW
ncbi:MAG: DUF4178 domain-containing protein [Acidobacteria bacterium]|nr:DUF4178 domain-containing protein [Acidobacteriota bacterium]